ARRPPRQGRPRRAGGRPRPARPAALAPAGDAHAGVEHLLGGGHELVVLRRAALPGAGRVECAARRRAGRGDAGRVRLTLSVGLGSLAMVVGLVVGVAVPGLAVPVVMLMLISGAPELVYVTLSTYLQHNTRSEYRATSMSIAEGCFSIQMLWLFPLTGYVIQHGGYELGFALCGALIVVGAALFIGSQRLPGLEQAGEEAAVTA